jgi:hypothetical protein
LSLPNGFPSFALQAFQISPDALRDIEQSRLFSLELQQSCMSVFHFAKE